MCHSRNLEAAAPLGPQPQRLVSDLGGGSSRSSGAAATLGRWRWRCDLQLRQEEDGGGVYSRGVERSRVWCRVEIGRAHV